MHRKITFVAYTYVVRVTNHIDCRMNDGGNQTARLVRALYGQSKVHLAFRRDKLLQGQAFLASSKHHCTCR